MTKHRWRETSLGQAVGGRRALRTGPFGSQLHAADYVDRGIPVLMPRDFAGGALRAEGFARVTEEKAAELARFRVLTGDVVLARRGEMGRCIRIESAQEGWLCGTGCLRIRPNGRLDGAFLTHFLRHPATVAWLADHAVGQTLPSLNVRTLAEVPVRLPPLEEQRKIAEIARHLERAKAASLAVIDRSRKIRDGLWRQLLAHGPPAGSAIAEGGHPRDWPPEPLGSLCTMTNGFPFRSADRSATGLPIIRIQNLNGSHEFHRFAGSPAAGWTVETGDLLFAWAGVKGSSFGPCLWPGPRGVLNQHIFRVLPGEGVVTEWLFETLRLVTRRIEEKAHGFKCDLLHVRKSEVLAQPVPVPPRRVQRWVAEQSRALTAIGTSQQVALDVLTRLKQGLIHDLLSGRVRAV